MTAVDAMRSFDESSTYAECKEDDLWLEPIVADGIILGLIW
jgi:hypothetical protein